MNKIISNHSNIIANLRYEQYRNRSYAACLKRVAEQVIAHSPDENRIGLRRRETFGSSTVSREPM